MCPSPHPALRPQAAGGGEVAASAIVALKTARTAIALVIVVAVATAATARGPVPPLSSPALSELSWLADSVVETKPAPERLPWSWGEAVMLLGLAEAAATTGNRAHLAPALRFLDAHVDSSGDPGLSVLFPDRIAPALVAWSAWRQTGVARYRLLCDRFADWLMVSAPRAADGAWYHLPILDWHYVDTLFMTSVFLAGFGKDAGRPELGAEAVRQHNLLADKLYSASDRLYWHGWDDNGLFTYWATPSRHHNGAFWGRGNGWAASALAYVLTAAEPGVPGYERARARLAAHLTALAEHQDAGTGLWWTVLDEPGGALNYTETSASALIAAAWLHAARHQLVDAPAGEVLRVALRGIRARIVADASGRAHVTGISGPTNPADYDGYVAIPAVADLPWGVGAALLVLVEAAATESAALAAR
ncbi:MAG: glycoside hydrolase family 88 protein [Candidatus Schekmanbacteria bacterium]|nr:glycoside hydrolase family 88 protein [Candidatus Schekmanbacteria bacterium]